jgi:hypothetical protein
MKLDGMKCLRSILQDWMHCKRVSNSEDVEADSFRIPIFEAVGR